MTFQTRHKWTVLCTLAEVTMIQSRTLITYNVRSWIWWSNIKENCSKVTKYNCIEHFINVRALYKKYNRTNCLAFAHFYKSEEPNRIIMELQIQLRLVLVKRLHEIQISITKTGVNKQVGDNRSSWVNFYIKFNEIQSQQ